MSKKDKVKTLETLLENLEGKLEEAHGVGHHDCNCGSPSNLILNISKNSNPIISLNFGDAEDYSLDDFDDFDDFDETCLDDLEEVSDFLEELGYSVIPHEDTLHVAIGSVENPFVAVFMINDNNELVITCRVAKLGDLNEDEIPNVQLMLLDANTRVRPYAFGIITGSDNPDLDEAEDFPIVLTDSIPLGDLSEDELEFSMESLLVALKASDDALRDGLKK